MKNIILPLVLLSSMLSFPIVNAQDAAPSIATSTSQIIFNDQSVYFISRNSVNVRSEPNIKSKVLGQLVLNDTVKIINPTTIYENNLIEISIVSSEDQIEKSDKYYMSSNFLSQEIIDYKEFKGKYFVVINVATETLRIYEKMCADNSCPNKMIMETEVAVGEDVDNPKENSGKGRSILGSFRINGWSKFYEDASGHYPSWYKEEYPDVPKAGSSWMKWFTKKIMPRDENGDRHGHMRGAFGWYTAFVGPEPFGQWVHGSVGWGSDKDKFIKKIKQGLINVITNPRSSGCTRNNNEAIAFLRHITNVGAPVIKIYAQEELLDPTLKNYSSESEDWNYIMTKNKDHAVDREEVLKSLGINLQTLNAFLEIKNSKNNLILDPTSPLNQVLESGTYSVDIHPDVIPYTPGEKLTKLSRSIGRKGNIYGIPSYQMHGIYYIDAGVLNDYAHPDTVLETSGFPGEVTPEWMKLSNIK